MYNYRSCYSSVSRYSHVPIFFEQNLDPPCLAYTKAYTYLSLLTIRILRESGLPTIEKLDSARDCVVSNSNCCVGSIIIVDSSTESNSPVNPFYSSPEFIITSYLSSCVFVQWFISLSWDSISFTLFLSFFLISVFSRFLVYKRLYFRWLEEVWDSQRFQLWGFAVRESEKSEELSGEPSVWSSWFRDCFIE